MTGRSYELGTAFGHIATGVDNPADLRIELIERLADEAEELAILAWRADPPGCTFRQLVRARA